MADQNTQGNQQQPNVDFSNVIQNLKYSDDTAKNIDTSLRTIISLMTQDPKALGSLRNATKESQSNYADSKWKYTPSENSRQSYRRSGNILEDFENGIKEQLMDSLAGGSFKNAIQGGLDAFAKEFGTDLRDLPKDIGKELTKQAYDAFKKSPMGQKIKGKLGELGNSMLDGIFKHIKGGDAYKSGIKNVVQGFLKGGANVAGSAGSASGSGILAGGKQVATTLLSSGGSTAAGGLAQAGGSKLAASIASGAAKLGPWGLLIAGIIITAVKVLGPAIQGFVNLLKSAGKSFNRDEDMRKKRMENAQKRLEADMKWMAEKPFEILMDATKAWEQTWDSNLRKTGQTQGYDKESVYALYEGYADRLRSEGLGSVISATDITDKLASVLDSGLSGKAAEEFAYIATTLGAAIPTQDFFGYADTYASIAANAIAQGKTQKEALDQANAELEQFASNLLYSSRELAGGFSTGLQNASKLFKDATQISQAAKTYNASAISGTLTSVSAIIGAVAPDLADSLVNNVVQAAIGGNNNSQIVALRSLAGINAGNTEFLQAMATDPQGVFTDLFSRLSNLQNMSPANYMEVAEGLASVFGVDAAAFARVDFKYLADAISSMQVNYNSLDQNLNLLASGQTTTSAEQLKAQEVNRVILEEGLAYVIDSEAGRMIQEHMWDEQRANALMENEYAVSIQGAALGFLEGIRKSMTTLMNFLNPVGFLVKGVNNLTQTVTESVSNEKAVADILRLGAVGNNNKAFYNLTTRGKDLGLTTSLVEMMGGKKLGGAASNDLLSKIIGPGGSNLVANAIQLAATGVITPTSAQFNALWDSGALTGYRGSKGLGNSINGVSSRYSWGIVGKSVANAMQATAMNNALIGGVSSPTNNAANQYVQKQTNAKFEKFIASATDAAANNMSYEQWVGTAKNYGISNFSDALETFGRSETELRDFFSNKEAERGAIVKEEKEQAVRKFWGYDSGANTGEFYSAIWFPFFGAQQRYDTRMDNVDTAMTIIQGQLDDIANRLGDQITDYTVIGELAHLRGDMWTTFVTMDSTFQKCLLDWTRYITETEAYTKAIGGNRTTAWQDLKNATKDQQTQATLALANALGVFTADQLKNMDPQLQANALLGEILVVLQAIMQQNNTQAGGLSLIDTISALGLGATKK